MLEFQTDHGQQLRSTGKWTRRIQPQAFVTQSLRCCSIARHHPVNERSSSRVSKSMHGLESHPAISVSRLWNPKLGCQALLGHLVSQRLRIGEKLKIANKPTVRSPRESAFRARRTAC